MTNASFQKLQFLHVEGDCWLERNSEVLRSRTPENDWVLSNWEKISCGQSKLNVLEIGCSSGIRLKWLQDRYDAHCFGVEPSLKACELASAQGLKITHGTADALPFDNGFFDVVIFGFCLYLCDRNELFKIAFEADRVLKPKSWLLIEDFYSPWEVVHNYHHKEGIKSYKMDYRTLFMWHPAYECFEHRVCANNSTEFTDDKDEWVSRSVLRKHLCQD